MLNLCTGNSRTRIKIECTRFYSQYELFRTIRLLNKSTPVWLEYGPNLYQPINTDHELRFACQLVEGDIESYMSSEDQEEHRRTILDQVHTREYENMTTRARRPRKDKEFTKPKRMSNITPVNNTTTQAIPDQPASPTDTPDE